MRDREHTQHRRGFKDLERTHRRYGEDRAKTQKDAVKIERKDIQMTT